ncbi:MAG: glycosyltransferase [Candidatus Limnocylindrales bacterium]
MADRTPVAWRLASLATLFGGALLGLAAGGRRGAGRIVGLASLVAAGYVVPLAAAGRRPPIPPGAPALDPSAPPPTFSVVVAGRDEAAVLPDLVRDVAGQDHRAADGTPLFELIVIDDRSTDGSGEAVRSAADAAGIGLVTRVIRRDGDDLPDGKGAALTAAQPEVFRGEVVVVLDADARIGSGFLGRLATYIAAGAGAITARRRILDAGSSSLAGAQADEQTLDGEIQRGRWALGGCSEFRGNGIVVRRDLLAEVGGWRAAALTEDLDLSSRLAARFGVTVAWALDAEVWEEPVRSFHGLWRQRVRWAEGGIRRVLEHGPSVLSSPALRPSTRLDFALYAGQLVIPSVILGSLGGALLRRRPGPAAALVGTYLAAGGALAWDGLRGETTADGGPLLPGERAARSVRVALFNGIWLGAIPVALWRLATRRGPVGYARMAHVGGGQGEWSR